MEDTRHISKGVAVDTNSIKKRLVTGSWRYCALAIALSTALASPCSGQCQYEVTIIRAPLCSGGGVPFQPGTEPEDISDTGVVVGSYQKCAQDGNREAFMWSEQTGFVTLPRPAGIISAQALAVSDGGSVIVGQMIKQSGPEPRTVAFVYLNGQMTNLGALPGHHHSYATGVIDANYIVGQSNNVLQGPQKGVRWVNQTVAELPAPPDMYSSARDVNRSSLIGGYVGILSDVAWPIVWQNDQSTQLPLAPGAFLGIVSTVNAGDRRAGSVAFEDPDFQFGRYRPAVWIDTNIPSVLPEIPDCYGSAGVADVADTIQMVGACRDENTVVQPILWHSGSPFDLNDLIVDDPQIELVKGAEALSNDGQIVTTIRTYINGVSGVVTGLLTPIESPPSDLNHDCITNVSDLFLLLSEWNVNGSFADINNSGNVDVSDLFLLLAGWG